ncbi:hypothetical protein LH612_30320, partial [Klebsiella pneumoniae]|nr:hypothetical protein [Klebsiella pneumoniae]
SRNLDAPGRGRTSGASSFGFRSCCEVALTISWSALRRKAQRAPENFERKAPLGHADEGAITPEWKIEKSVEVDTMYHGSPTRKHTPPL